MPLRRFRWRGSPVPSRFPALALLFAFACGLASSAAPDANGQDFFQQLFSGFQDQHYRPRPAYVPWRGARRERHAPAIVHRRHETRHEARRDARATWGRRAEPAPEATKGGTNSYCVRECDGYFFPVGIYSGASDFAAHQRTCDKLCPGAKTTLYLTRSGSDGMDDAVTARGGSLYSRLTAALQRRKQPDQPCSCRTDETAEPTKAIYHDFTLRPGDAVMTARGVAVFHGGSRLPHDAGDFRSLAETRDLPHRTLRILATLERANRHGRVAHERRARLLEEHRSQTGGGDKSAR